MIAYVRLALLLIVFVGSLAMTCGARHLLDAYDNCYNGEIDNLTATSG